MINAKEARELAMKAKAQKAEIAIAYFYNEFKRFDEQIEKAASIHGKTHLVLRFNTSSSFYEISSEKREELIRNYYEKEGFTVTLNPRINFAFTLSW